MGVVRLAARSLAAGAGLAAASYGAYVAVTWLRFGRRARPADHADSDSLLDRFIPAYDVAERHHVRIAAPADIVLAVAGEIDFRESRMIRGIFRAREWILGSRAETRDLPRPLLSEARALGWGVLAEIPQREIVLGAVTQPWLADVVFQSLPPDRFADFDEPGYVKIAWTLRADPVGPAESVFSTETRVATTDPTARAAFRRYWSVFSPGILLIRTLLLRLVKAKAEQRIRAGYYAAGGRRLISSPP
jgi:hypothetical protein